MAAALIESAETGMHVQSFESKVAKAVEAELGRTEYPANLQPLPPVPAGRYCDPEFYALELERLFKRNWLQVGHVSEIAEIGSYKVFDQLGLSIIVSRTCFVVHPRRWVVERTFA